MTPDAEAHSLVAPYVLHALSDDEVARFESHLGQCSSCRDEVDDIREVAARLGAGEVVDPSDELRQRVIAAAAAARRARAATETSTGRHRAGSWWRRQATRVGPVRRWGRRR